MPSKLSPIQKNFGIPSGSTSMTEVLRTLDELKSLNPEFNGTLMSIGTNFGNDNIHEVLNAANAEFSHDNNMVVFARPGSKIIEDELLEMCAALLGGDVPGVLATISSGGTESIFNAVHAARERSRQLRPDIVKPNWVASFNAHGALTKACHFLDIELIRLPDKDFRADVDAISATVNNDTIGIYASAPNFPFGLYDDIPALGRLALEKDLWLHVDACVGGFLAPFATALGKEIPSWNFSVPGVTSMSADIHKYGYGLKPASVTVWRNKDLLQFHHVVVDDWPMGTYVTPGFVGSRPGGPIAAAWSVMKMMGVEGYKQLAAETFGARDKILEGLREIEGIEVPIPKPDLSIIVYRSVDVPMDQLLVGMEERGWVHFVVHEPELVELVIDPGISPFVDKYLSDLDEVLKLARTGINFSGQRASTYAGEG